MDSSKEVAEHFNVPSAELTGVHQVQSHPFPPLLWRPLAIAPGVECPIFTDGDSVTQRCEGMH